MRKRDSKTATSKASGSHQACGLKSINLLILAQPCITEPGKGVTCPKRAGVSHVHRTVDCMILITETPGPAPEPSGGRLRRTRDF